MVEISLATPLAAYIRVPLSWYHSTTYAFFPDETHTLIRRVYTHPSQDHSKRHFCGYCGTPLSYWSENPQSEAEYIHLTLGSLLQEDLRDLEDMGLIPEDSMSEEEASTDPQATTDNPTASTSNASVLRQSYGVPWFDGMVEGTRLGKMRRNQGIRQSQDGKVSVEWEVVEYSDDDQEGDQDVEMEAPSSSAIKRKLQDRDDPEVVDSH